MREYHFATASVLPTNEAVAEALRFGWIDSKPSAFDKERSMLWVHLEFELFLRSQQALERVRAVGPMQVLRAVAMPVDETGIQEVWTRLATEVGVLRSRDGTILSEARRCAETILPRTAAVSNRATGWRMQVALFASSP